MKLKKGSAEAKRFMASIRAKKKGAKKTAVKKTAVKKAPKKTAVKKASTHKDTKSHNVKISVVSGLKVHKNWFDFDVYKNYMFDIMKDTKGKKSYIVYDENAIKEVYETNSLTLVKKYIDKMIKTKYLYDKRKYQLDQLRNPNKYK